VEFFDEAIAVLEKIETCDRNSSLIFSPELA
jgi:hypothetical protein